MVCMATEVNIPQWTVGDRLRKARETAGIGVEEIAARLGRNRNSVTRYERSRTVDINLVRSYSALTGTPLEWLLTGHGPDDPDSREVSTHVTQRYFGDNRRDLMLVAMAA